jgi:hypothetical protein
VLVPVEGRLGNHPLVVHLLQVGNAPPLTTPQDIRPPCALRLVSVDGLGLLIVHARRISHGLELASPFSCLIVVLVDSPLMLIGHV